MVRIVIFAKAPEPGKAKTRLIPALGANGAAQLARRMLAHTLLQAASAGADSVELCATPSFDDGRWAGVDLPASVICTAQGDGDLGEKMARAVDRVSTTTRHAAMLIGTDCPALDAPLLTEAALQLASHDAVMIPAADGGYVLIGLKAPCPQIFTGMAWSTSSVAFETLRRLALLGLSVWLGPTLHDIDEPADLVHLPEDFNTSPTVNI